jgi:hypothetical protein
MKKYMQAVCLASALFFTAGAASALPQVDEIVVNQGPGHTPEGTNIRVNILNDGMAAESPSMNVVLYARETGATDWMEIKSWNHNLRTEAGRLLSYDYFGLADPNQADNPLFTPAYELKAVMEDGNGMALESTAVYASHTDSLIYQDTADVQLLENGDVIFED